MANKVAIATYKYDAKQPGDLSFGVGDYITVLDANPNGWWTGRTSDGRQGVFPYNRVKLLEGNKSPTMSPQPVNVMKPKTIVDRINNLRVHSETGKAQPLSFSIEVTLSNSSNVKGKKSMKDFRVLNDAFNSLNSTTQTSNGGFYKRTTDAESYELTSPEWSDNMFLERTQIAQRARQLQQFLEGALGEDQMEYLIVCWLDPNANFSLKESKKNTTKEVLMQAIKIGASKRDQSKPVPQLVRAAYDWVQRDDQEINLSKNEVVAVLEKNTMFNGWWLGQKTNGKTGVFPYNYVQEIPPNIAEKLVNPQSETSQSGLMPPPQSPKKDTTKPIFTDIRSDRIDPQFLSKNGKTARNRKRVTGYGVCSTEAFDELLQHGISIEENGRLARFAGRTNTPKNGDSVTVFYSAYIWEPQKQQLLEFASSDLLIGGGSQDDAQGPLEFTMGLEQAIEGVEEAVSRMEKGQSVRVTLTPEKAYGAVGFPPQIPGNAYLVYELTLNEIMKNTVSVNPNGGAAFKSTVVDRVPSGGFTSFHKPKPAHGRRKKKKKPSHQPTASPGGASSPQLKPVDSETFKKKFTLPKLQEILRKRQFEEYGIAPGIIEEYLTEEEFTKAFNVDHFTWLLMPAFRRKQLKQELNLF